MILGNPIAWLRANGAQRDVIDGLSRFTTWHTLWAECPRGDWLLGIVERMGVDHVALVRAAIDCARGVVKSREASAVLETAEGWTRGGATLTDVADATQRLEESSSRAMDAAEDAANRAALAVGFGVEDRRVLPTAAATTAEAAMMASLDTGWEQAMRSAHARCADAVRAHVSWSVFEGHLASTLAR